jgi:transcription-repair coupling factor (superfamily II helicase)
MLKQAVGRMKGEPDSATSPDQHQAILRLDFLALTPEEATPAGGKGKNEPRAATCCGAFIPTTYLPEPKLRIEAHRSLSAASDDAALEALATSWRDRFGPLPVEVKHLLTSERIRRTAGARGITKVETRGERLMLTRGGDFLLLGHRFPRLTATKPASKLSEVLRFLEALKR